MSKLVSAAPLATSNQNMSDSKCARPTATFRPTVWATQFLPNSSPTPAEKTNIGLEQEYEELKAEVRKIIFNGDNNLSERFNLIDAAQRLGVAYLFAKEIDDSLEKIFQEINFDDEIKSLHDVALGFRLLRQQGFNVSSDVFNKFKDHKGEFMESIISDVQGMLSLYEAAHLAIHGEDILDEAIAFTTAQLKSKLSDISSPSLAKQVTRALTRPIHHCLERLAARHFISIYQEDDSHNETLLRFAKLDFKNLQALHQKEVAEISVWWKELDFESKLPYARDRAVECYFWILGVFFEPQHHVGRMFLSKVLSLTSVLDDTYDAYGTFEELKLYTQAIERWDLSAMDPLPEYMKVSYKALFDVFKDIEQVTTEEGRPYCVRYAKEAMKRLTKAYSMENKWCLEGYVPTMREYILNGIVTSCYPMLVIVAFAGMGHLGTKEAFDWAATDPKIVVGSSVLTRLINDLVSHKLERERDHVVSGVECYMKEHGATEEEAYAFLNKEIEHAWKDMNEDFIKPTAVPMPLLTRILNLARASDVVYKIDDAYTLVSQHLRDAIAALLVDPILA